MEGEVGNTEIDNLERGLLLSGNRSNDDRRDDEVILYTASFAEMEENFVKYILRKDIHSRKLYVTPDAIVYQVVRPVPFPCFGVLKKEKHVVLPSVADVVVEQGYLQSLFGLCSIRIESAGIRRPPSDDVQIHGVANPRAFRKAVLTHLSNMRSEAFSKQVSTVDDVPNLRMSSSKSLKYDSNPYLGEPILLKKLEEVGCSVKRVETLIEERQPQTAKHFE